MERQREEKIEKLKVATKYNSTQQLLEKYGGESPSPSPARPSSGSKGKGDRRKSGLQAQAQQQPQMQQQYQQPPAARTGLAPPPTANIRRPSPPDQPTTPNTVSPPPYAQAQPQPSIPSPSQPSTEEPGFAPNAFPSVPQYIEQSHWYDRLLDVLLGEDETQPKNRIALICRNCRLVNGQAPPGVKTLEMLGRWRCGSCGVWNGESETAKVLDGIRQTQTSPSPAVNTGGNNGPASSEDEFESGNENGNEMESEQVRKEEEDEDEDDSTTRKTRSQAKSKSKG